MNPIRLNDFEEGIKCSIVCENCPYKDNCDSYDDQQEEIIIIEGTAS